MADEIRGLLVLLADGHVIAEPLLISLMSCFREAKLDPGEDLRELMAERLMQETDLEQEFEPAQIDQALESLAQGFKGDAFELHEQLSDISQSMPPDYREVLVAQAAVAPFDLLRETAVFSLLDSSPQMRARTAELLAQTGPVGSISGRSLGRMMLLRNWLPEPERPLLDKAIHQARQNGTQPLPVPRRFVQQVLGTAIDGAGAQSIFAVAKEGRKYVFGGLLVKQEVGVADVWCLHNQSKSELKALIRTIRSEVAALPVHLDFVGTLLRHYLAVGMKHGTMPPAGLLDLVESLGMGECQAREMSTDDLLEVLQEEINPAMLQAEAVDRILEQALEWESISTITESWYEDDRQIRDFIHDKRGLDRKTKVDQLLDDLLEQRRHKWSERFFWTALWAKSVGQRQLPWGEFFVLARELRGGRPLREIPIMRRIAETTLAAEAFSY
jgi:hypothetical protein